MIWYNVHVAQSYKRYDVVICLYGNITVIFLDGNQRKSNNLINMQNSRSKIVIL